MGLLLIPKNAIQPPSPFLSSFAQYIVKILTSQDKHMRKIDNNSDFEKHTAKTRLNKARHGLELSFELQVVSDQQMDQPDNF